MAVTELPGREKELRKLADLLMFTIEERNGRYSLRRTIDVSRPIEQTGLTLDEAEELLNTWKLRGAHGG